MPRRQLWTTRITVSVRQSRNFTGKEGCLGLAFGFLMLSRGLNQFAGGEVSWRGVNNDDWNWGLKGEGMAVLRVFPSLDGLWGAGKNIAGFYLIVSYVSVLRVFPLGTRVRPRVDILFLTEKPCRGGVFERGVRHHCCCPNDQQHVLVVGIDVTAVSGWLMAATRDGNLCICMYKTRAGAENVRRGVTDAWRPGLSHASVVATLPATKARPFFGTDLKHT
ncbi:hypothetical protein TcasGA2_TC032320 [Tribolium castaneum]|uniref:Uncharacterized protein n=1 Tax=Tribolium castaneum TaxID=7070 RepID=A0A139WLR5_TRICA|nr:hypothetical protein TcasGA2_TC032320 [Tribolium castaneum]